MTFGAGGSLTSGGQTYTLPKVASTELKYSDPTAFMQQNPFQQDAGAGSAEWYKGLFGG
jgi:hypothetical protein